MDRLLINYLPPVLREVQPLKAALTAEQPEVERLWNAQNDILENQFLVSSTGYGVKRWEQILQIHPKDTDGLETRRARVLAVLRLKLPYSVQWLRRWLDDLCGSGNYGLKIMCYTVVLYLGYDVETNFLDELRLTIRKILPVHLVILFNLKDSGKTTSPNTFLAKEVRIQVGASNYLGNPIRFNGAVPFDGSIAFNQIPAGRFQSRSLRIFSRIAELSSTAASLSVQSTVRNSNTANNEGIVVRQAVGEQNSLHPVSVRIHAIAVNRNRHPVELTRDTRHAFDGVYRFDGTRRFNAGLVTEPL